MDLEPKDAFSVLSAVAIAGVGWLWRQISGKVTREELKSFMDQNERQFERLLARFDVAETTNKEDRAEIYGSMRRAVENQSETNVELSAAVGELKGALNRRR